MIGALELGLIYGVMALGVYLTFRILNFPDLTVDGSFTTGAAVSAAMIASGQNPLLSTLAGAAAGLVAGAVTGVLHTITGDFDMMASVVSRSTVDLQRVLDLISNTDGVIRVSTRLTLASHFRNRMLPLVQQASEQIP